MATAKQAARRVAVSPSAVAFVKVVIDLPSLPKAHIGVNIQVKSFNSSEKLIFNSARQVRHYNLKAKISDRSILD